MFSCDFKICVHNMSYDFIYVHVILCDFILLLHLVSLWPFTTPLRRFARNFSHTSTHGRLARYKSNQDASNIPVLSCAFLYWYPQVPVSSLSAVTAVRCDLQNESRRRRGAIRHLLVSTQIFGKPKETCQTLAMTHH